MASPRTNFYIASTVGITLSSFFSGGNLVSIYIALPALLLPAPTSSKKKTGSSTSTSTAKPATPGPQLARQWRVIYNKGKGSALPVIAVNCASFVFAALQLPESDYVQRRLFLAAAGMIVSAVPYTLIFMAKTNDLLFRRAEEGDAMTEVNEGDVTEVGMSKGQGLEGYRTEDLIRRWGVLNTVRAALPLVGIGFVVTALIW